MSLTNVLKDREAQSIVEYIVVFTVLGVFCLGMIVGLMVDNPNKPTTHQGAVKGLSLHRVFGEAINSAINQINN